MASRLRHRRLPAAAGNQVIGLDLDAKVVADLVRGKPPISEPGLTDLIAEADSRQPSPLHRQSRRSPGQRRAVLWVAFDTPVNEKDEADVDFVRSRLNRSAPPFVPARSS